MQLSTLMAERPPQGVSGAILWGWPPWSVDGSGVWPAGRVPLSPKGGRLNRGDCGSARLSASSGGGGAPSPSGSANYAGAGHVVVPSLFLFVPADPEESQAQHDVRDEFAEDFPEGCPQNAWRLISFVDHHNSKGHFPQGLASESREDDIDRPAVCP